MTAAEVLCIGSAVIDITARAIDQKTPWQEKQRISAIEIQTGGDAANQSIRLADLGVGVSLAACVGDDQNGTMLKSALAARGVDVQYMTAQPGASTGTALVLVDDDGERHVFSVQGAHSLLAKEMLPGFLPAGCKAISLASIFSMPLLEKDGLTSFLQKMQADGVLVFADLAADKLGLGLAGVRDFLPMIDYFLPSLYDAQAMTGKETAEEAAQVYLACGAKYVIIKCGAEGCYYAGENRQGWIPAVPVQPVDTTGAGDCMNALFISRILAGDAIEEACRYACAGASCSTLFFGASKEKLTRDRIDQFIKNYNA